MLEKRKEATKSEAKKVITHLVDTIAKNRNIIAHAMLDPSGMWQFNRDRETISFIKYANEKKTVSYKKTDIVKLLDLINAVKSLPLIIKSEKHTAKLIRKSQRVSPVSPRKKTK